MNIPIEIIRVDALIQQRVEHINEAILTEYADVATASWPFPPIVVFRDDQGRHWLADGFHRVAAARRAGNQEIPASILAGDRDDALLFAASANAHHGLRRTNADKRKAVRTLLTHPKFCGLSDRAIADHCAVHHQMVGTIRSEMANALDESSSQTDKPGATPLDDSSSQSASAVDQDGNVVEVEAIDPPSKSPLAAPKSPTVRTTANGRKIDTAGIAASNKKRVKTPPPVTEKTAQQALQGFVEACADLRTAEKHLQQAEMFKIAQFSRDTLIWCLPRIAQRDASDICEKINDAQCGGE